MERIALSIHDLNNKKVCDVYDSTMKVKGEAHSINLTSELNGWKELTFVLPYLVEDKLNYRWKYIQNEYKIRQIKGNDEDWFKIIRPKNSHSSGIISSTVVCHHISSTQKTKNLYLTFDDTNGIGTCPELMEKVLVNTGWTLGTCDTFYERDGVTEKIRSLSSDGKAGAYKLISTICGLFDAYPVFNGSTRTVDVRALANKNPQKEMIIGKNLSALNVEYDSDSLVTRLYVEGEYGEDGYVGIEDVNPTGLSYLLNFDYYKEIGLFTDEHQAALDSYLENMKNSSSSLSQIMGSIISLENELNELWGQPKFVYYRNRSMFYKSNDVVDEDTPIESGDTLYELLSDGTYQVITAPTSSTNDMIKFVTPTSSLIGAREAAVEAKNKIIKSLQEETPSDAINEQIQSLQSEITNLYNGTEDSEGLYKLMHDAALVVIDLKSAYDNLETEQNDQGDIEAEFVQAMGDFLRDGYWSNNNYIPGQEEHLYQDAIDISKELAYPKVSYTISHQNATNIWGDAINEYQLNSGVRLIDPDLAVNDIVFIVKVVECLDDLSRGSVEISNDELSITGKSFDSVLGRISQLADLLDQKNALYSRAESIDKDGTIAIQRLNGTIDILKNKLMASTSSWYTDDNGNIIFLSVNGKSAMMLSGEGFMIANGKTEEGEWNWRTFGTGEGFTADAIVTGYLSAERIEAGTIGAAKLSTEVQDSLGKVSVLEEKIAEINLDDDSIISTVLNSQQYLSNQESLQETIEHAAVWVNGVAPESPEVDALWLDISATPSLLKCWDGEEWITVNDTDLLKERMTMAEEKITDDAIVNTVRTNSEYLADLSRTEQSAVTQTKSEFEIRFTEVESVANAANEAASGLQQTLDTWYSFGADALEIGKSGSPFKTRQDNETYKFINNGSVVASMSGSVSAFPQAYAQNELRIGGLKGIVNKSTGGISWVYVGFDD